MFDLHRDYHRSLWMCALLLLIPIIQSFYIVIGHQKKKNIYNFGKCPTSNVATSCFDKSGLLANNVMENYIWTSKIGIYSHFVDKIATSDHFVKNFHR